MGQRQIKFRAWDYDRKIMVSPEDIARISFNPTPFALTDIGGSGDVGIFKFDLMQYTGLNDATRWEELAENEREEWIEKWERGDWKGKPIYGGDIFKDRWGNIRDVHWWNVMGGWCSKCHSDTGSHPEFDHERISQGWITMKGCKLIGNIHEHSHLLEKEKV